MSTTKRMIAPVTAVHWPIGSRLTPRGADGRGFTPSRGYAARFRTSQPGDCTAPPAVRRSRKPLAGCYKEKRKKW